MGIFKQSRPPSGPANRRADPLHDDAPPSVAEGRIESAVDRAVRDGLLNDVAGKGRPLPDEYLDSRAGEFLARKILREQGFVPDWAVWLQAVDAADQRIEDLLADGRVDAARAVLSERNQLVAKANRAAPSPVLQRGPRSLEAYRRPTR
jgi:hypothetical protein